MPVKFKRGEQVRQIMPAPLQGEITAIDIVEDEVGYLVTQADGSGRWFKEQEIEAVPE